MQTILLIGVIAECVLLLGLAAFKKCTRKAFLIISAVTAVCCAVVAVAGGGSAKGTDGRESSVKGHVYMAAQLLDQGKPEDALRAIGQVTEAEGEKYGVQGLRGLAYNHAEAYSSGAYLLESATETDLVELYTSCINSERGGEELSQRIIQNSLDQLSLSETEAARYDAEMAIRYGSQKEVTEDSEMILQIRAAAKENEVEKAYELATQNAADGSIADDILVSEMYIRDYNQNSLAQTDEAFDALLQNVTDIQIKLNRIAAESGMEGKEYSNAYAQYQLALLELNGESAKRAGNYLSYYYTENTVYDLAYYIQMSKLMLSSDEKEQAVSYLDKVFKSKDLDMTQWLAVDIMLLKEAYLDGMGSMENAEFDSHYLQLMESLYQGVFEDIYVNTDYYDFLRSYLQDIFSGIYISRPDVSNFPTVSVSVSTSSEMELTADSFILTDTAEKISSFEVVENEDASMSICFVLDRSGSMQGTYIASAKQAIKSFATSMDADTGAALVSFENAARVDCPLVDSAYMVAAQVEKIHASGGTNISSGLLCGAEQLSSVAGKKVIILLSDGVDGNAGQMPATLNQLKMDGIVVYAIGLPGCDEAYLSNISSETGGTYFPASNAASLSAIYDEIRGFLRNSYTVTYQVGDTEQTERTIWIEAVDSMAQSRRMYTTDTSTEQYSQIYDAQSSDLFKQIGGTLGGY